MKNLSIQTKGIAMIGGIFLMLVVSAWWVNKAFSEIQRAVVFEQQTIVPVSSSLARVKFNIVQVQQWLTDISATRGQDGLNDGFDVAQEFSLALQNELQALKAILPEHNEIISKIESGFAVFYRDGKLMAEAYIAEGPNGGNPLMGNFDRASEQLQIDVETLSAIVITLHKEGTENINAGLAQGQWITPVVFVLAIVISLVLFLTLKFMLLQPIHNLVYLFSQLNAGKADIHFRFKVKQMDEIGTIQTQFNEFMGALSAMTTGVAGHAETVAAELEKLEVLSKTNLESIHQQLSETVQVSAAMNELSANSQEVSSATGLLASNVDNMSESVNKSADLSSGALRETTVVSNRIEQASGTIQKLDEQADAIIAIVDTIETIAAQTNLLALNAAIEAARAGEQGRGFAVVADEVRTLATRTQSSTIEINTIIKSLKEISLQAVDEMDSCNQEIKGSLTLSQNNLAALSEIKTAFIEIGEQMVQTVSAMEQQTSVCAVNAESILKIRDASGVAEQAISNGDDSVRKLSDRVIQLKTLAQTFS